MQNLSAWRRNLDKYSWRIIGVVIGILLVYRLFFEMGYPWTCKQAQTALKEAEQEWKAGFRTDPNPIVQVQAKIQRKLDAEQAVTRKCY